FPFLDERQQLLAHRVALAPALERSNDILACHRLSVMELETVSQRERPCLPVRTCFVSVHHLRLNFPVRVHSEQGVVDHVAVVYTDGLGGPNWIQDGPPRPSV